MEWPHRKNGGHTVDEASILPEAKVTRRRPKIRLKDPVKVDIRKLTIRNWNEMIRHLELAKIHEGLWRHR